MSASLTEKGSLTLAVLFCTMPTFATSTRRVAGVNGVQWDTCQSSFIREEETQLPEGPGALSCTLRVSNRAFRPLTDVSKFLNRYSLLVGFGLLHNAFGDDMIGMLAEAGFPARKFIEMTLSRLRATLLKALPERVPALRGFST